MLVIAMKLHQRLRQNSISNITRFCTHLGVSDCDKYNLIFAIYQIIYIKSLITLRNRSCVAVIKLILNIPY